VRTLEEQQPGHDLKLSINRRIQYIAYRELMAGIKENLAESGSAIVVDVRTGEILAMVNQPSFNPNKRTAKESDAFRNRALTDTFEPGSTIKAFSVASAFASGKYTPSTLIDTYPGWFRVGHNVVHDESNVGELTITQILQLSSNVGATKMILSLPQDQLWKMLHQVGFGEITGIGFPGERSGELLHRNHWDPFALATLSFGYGMSATTLQLTQAYMIFANHGIKIPLSLLRIDKPPVGTRVISDKVANQMMEVLEAVVSKDSGKEEKSTGRKAKIQGYRVAGKTGTAKIVGLHGYEKRYVSSFVGIAPVSHPRFVVAVVIRDPRGKSYYAATVTTPIFKKIMEATLHALNVPPDASV
jgi:cell division protein FtsI (penicillin-binding protein 3)